MLDRFRRRPDPEFVFVVTFGRSGSTLTQGLLNAMPRTLIRGENGFYFHGLFSASHAGLAFARRHAKHHAGRPSSAFYGVKAITPERFALHARRLTLDLLVGDEDPRDFDRIGFKEVLWHQVAPAHTEAFFDWFDRAFPGAKLVLNTRDIEVAVGSGFWQRQDREEAIARMERVIEIQDYLEQRWPDRVFRTRYEVLTGDDTAARDAMLLGLAGFVTGGCDDELLGQLHATLEVGHGPNPFGSSRREGADPSPIDADG